MYNLQAQVLQSLRNLLQRGSQHAPLELWGIPEGKSVWRKGSSRWQGVSAFPEIVPHTLPSDRQQKGCATDCSYDGSTEDYTMPLGPSVARACKLRAACSLPMSWQIKA